MNRPLRFRVLLVGIALVVVVAAAVIQRRYITTVTEAKEMVLRDDLSTMRSVIHQYTLDKRRAPQSLQDLVSAGYLKSVPKDPFTNSPDTWRTTPDNDLMDPNPGPPGITDVHSGARGSGSNGKPYSSW